MTEHPNDWHNPEPIDWPLGEARTREFLAGQPKEGNFARRFHAKRGHHHDLDEPCTMVGVPPDQAQALIDIGFRPLRKVHQSIGRVQVDVERWIGPDGAVLFETSDRGKQFMLVIFDNGRKLTMTQPDFFGWLSKLVQLPHRYIFRTNDLVADYERMVREMGEYADKHDSRPLYRTNRDLDEAVWDYYDHHVVSMGYLGFVYLQPLIGIVLGLLAWLLIEFLKVG